MKDRIERIIPFKWQVENGDFFLIMKKLAQEKAVKVDKAITSPKAERLVNRVAVFLILVGVAYFGIHVLLRVIR